jgi:putative DNA primase/helicase
MKFQELNKMRLGIINERFAAGLYSRAISLIPVIRHNAVIFAEALADELNDQRAGDQIGTLIAGAFALTSTKQISLERAKEWVKSQNWYEAKGEIRGQSDEINLITLIFQSRARIVRDTGTHDEIPIGELLDVATGTKEYVGIGEGSAREMLLRIGIKIEGEYFYISNSHPDLARMLKDTPWAVNWGRILNRIRGAITSEGSISFGSRGAKTRAVGIPLKFLGELK